MDQGYNNIIETYKKLETERLNISKELEELQKKARSVARNKTPESDIFDKIGELSETDKKLKDRYGVIVDEQVKLEQERITLREQLYKKMQQINELRHEINIRNQIYSDIVKNFAEKDPSALAMAESIKNCNEKLTTFMTEKNNLLNGKIAKEEKSDKNKNISEAKDFNDLLKGVTEELNKMGENTSKENSQDSKQSQTTIKEDKKLYNDITKAIDNGAVPSLDNLSSAQLDDLGKDASPEVMKMFEKSSEPDPDVLMNDLKNGNPIPETKNDNDKKEEQKNNKVEEAIKCVAENTKAEAKKIPNFIKNIPGYVKNHATAVLGGITALAAIGGAIALLAGNPALVPFLLNATGMVVGYKSVFGKGK